MLYKKGRVQLEYVSVYECVPNQNKNVFIVILYLQGNLMLC